METNRPHSCSLCAGILAGRRRWPYTLPLIALATITTSALLGQAAPPPPAHQNNPAAGLIEEPDWQSVCSRALKQPLPPVFTAFANSIAVRNAPKAGRCDEHALYYGFGNAPQYQTALQCAYWHRAHPEVPSDNALDGAGTLAMLYANGYGVARDYSLAIRFACEVGSRGGSYASGRIGQLEAMRDGKLPAGTRFDLCDGQMSGAMQAYCADLAEKQADVGRAQRIAAVKTRLSPQAQAMLPGLQAAEAAFEQARIKGEYTGGSGSGSVGFALGDQNLLREQFVVNLERFGAGQLPEASSTIRRQAQVKLDAAYAAELDAHRDPAASGLTATQTAWQQLFRQWMLFVPVAFPNLSQDNAATELLRLRIHQLKKLTS